MDRTATIPARIEQVARLIRQMTSQERAWLLALVPELREAGPIPAFQSQLMSYFAPRLSPTPGSEPMDEAPFIAGLTVGEFFALPEAEQARLWNQAHAEAERELGKCEHPVHADALLAR